MDHSTALRDAVAIACAMLTALANGLGVTAQHLASTSSTTLDRGWRFIMFLARHPLWLVGWIAMGGSLLFQSLALHFAAMSVVQPILVFELVLALVVRRLWLHQRVARRAWTASMVTVLALGLFLVATTRQSGLASHLRWSIPSAISVAVVVLLVLGGRRGSPGRRAALLGSATAVLWALEAAFIKECTDVITRGGFSGLVASWSFYAFIGCGIAGLVVEQTALHVGPLRSSQTAIVVVDPLVSVVLGAWIFGEHLGTTWSWRVIALLSLLVTLVSARILIASTPDTMEASPVVHRIA